ncbi:MAG: fibronectin type III domain-containing protein, partial [Clostridium sp.]|nr:fibronectin type III domain-containing protein [Clostridium sp.]
MALMLVPIASHAQNTLTVADGTNTNNYVPVYGLYVDDFVRCQTIYPASELEAAASTQLMAGGTISSLTYYLSSPAAASWGEANFVVNIKEVMETTLSGFVDMTDATTVYTGSLDGTQSTMTITFATPYTYQGGNLLVEIYNTLEGTYKSASFYGVNTDGASWQGNNGISIDTITGSARNFIPKTTFTFTGGTAITCFPVSDLAVSDITSTGATLSWSGSASGYTVYEYANVDSNGLMYTDTFAVLNTLTPNTEYLFGVVADCGNDGESTMRSISFRTACTALGLPYTCGFEGDELQGTANADALPWCSQRYVSVAATSGLTYPYSYNSSTYAYEGSRSLYFYGTTNSSYPDTQAIILPEIDVTSYPMNGNRITFWARMSSASYQKNLYVCTMSDPSDISTLTLLDSVLISGNTYTKYSVPLANASATDAYLVLATVGRTSGSIYLDELTIEEMPSCLEVPSVSVSGTTSSSITITWEANELNASATYTIYNGENVVASNIADTTYTIDNLEANTEYTFGVQANCPAGDAAITTVTGRTDCGAFSVPYTWGFEDMDANATPLCWTKNGDGNTKVTSSTTASHSGGKYLKFSGSTSNLIVLPETQDEINTLQLRFWTRPESFTNSNCGTFSVGYMTNAADAQTFVEVANYTYSDFTAYDEKYVTFTDAPAGARIAMRHNAVTTNWYWYVDDVTIETAPSCLPVSQLAVSNITANGATLTWTGDADGYTIYNMAD